MASPYLKTDPTKLTWEELIVHLARRYVTNLPADRRPLEAGLQPKWNINGEMHPYSQLVLELVEAIAREALSPLVLSGQVDRGELLSRLIGTSSSSSDVVGELIRRLKASRSTDR